MSDTHSTVSDAADSAVVLGAYARIDPGAAPTLRDRLSDLAGVTLFDLNDSAKVGMVLEADSADDAHHLLTHTVARLPGVLGVWPVSVELDDPSAGPAPAGPTAPEPSPAPSLL